jgi:uncharacterized protein (TIGR04222 family)
MNPFDLRGPEFLVFYAIFAAVLLTAIHLLRDRLESDEAPKIDLGDPYLLAYLRAGKDEALRVAIVSLVDRGLLIYDGTNLQRADNASPQSVRRPLEIALLERFAQPGEARTIFFDLKLEAVCVQYEDRLKRDRLLPGESTEQTRLLLIIVAVVLLVGVAGAKVLIALSRGRTNVAFLIIMAVIAIVVAVKVLSPRLTARGAALLADARSLYGGLKQRAATIPPGGATIDAMMLASIFGVDALAGDGFAYTRVLFPRSTSSFGSSNNSCSTYSATGSCSTSSGSSCGSSCGGGGCGGGCGGCGS